MGQGLGLVGAERRNSCGLCCGVDRFEQRLAGAAAGAGDADPKALLQFTKQCLEEVTASVMHAAAGVTARLDQQVCVCLWILVFGFWCWSRTATARRPTPTGFGGALGS